MIPVGLAFAQQPGACGLAVDLYSPDIKTFDNGQPVYGNGETPQSCRDLFGGVHSFCVLTGQSPEGLICICWTGCQLAAALQRVAYRTVENFQKLNYPDTTGGGRGNLRARLYRVGIRGQVCQLVPMT